MPVYIIRCGDTDIVKIGWAEDVEKRRRDLQTAHYQELKTIRVIDGPFALEGLFHRYFSDLLVRGEWFRFSEAMLTVSAEEVTPPPPAITNKTAPIVVEGADPVLSDIEAFLVRADMTATAFGARALNDPTLVHELRRGRECKRSTARRILTFIEGNP